MSIEPPDVEVLKDFYLDVLSCQILIQYYLEIIVLHHKINSLYNTEENTFDEIIEMITMQ